MRRGRRPESDCTHVPILMAEPGHPQYVRVECCLCHMQTGYALDWYEAWEAWRDGNVVMPYDIMEEE